MHRQQSVDLLLCLRAEPDNAFDPNAIMVWIDTATLSNVSGLDDALAGYGSSVADLQADQSAFHLGYIAREEAAVLKASGFPEDTDVSASFAVSARGKALVRLDTGAW